MLDLEKMRQSKLYSELITPESVEKMTNKYHFKGHLGDQDFFTLIGIQELEATQILFSITLIISS